MSATVEERARRLHTQTVVFRADSMEETVGALAQLGQTTEAIAAATGLTVNQVIYRVTKTQRVLRRRLRAEFRNGGGLAGAAAKVLMRRARRLMRKQVAPVYLPHAAHRLNQ